MASASSISSTHSYTPTYDNKATDLKTFDFQITDQEINNKYAIHKFNLYEVVNNENFNFWIYIQVNFEKFEMRHFNELDSSTWKKIISYCYLHRFWINHNFGPSKTCTTAMLEAIAANWYDDWTLEQIKWVEKCYHIFSTVTYKCKQKLTGIPHLKSTSNLELNTAGQRTQQFQDIRF